VETHAAPHVSKVKCYATAQLHVYSRNKLTTKTPKARCDRLLLTNSANFIIVRLTVGLTVFFMWRPLLGDRGRITKHSVCHSVILIFVFVRQKYFGEVFLRPPPSPAAPWVLYFALKLTHYASISTVVLLVTF